MELREVYKRVRGVYPSGRADRVNAVLSLIYPASLPLIASSEEIAQVLSSEAKKRGILESFLMVSIDSAGYLLIDGSRVLRLVVVGGSAASPGADFFHDAIMARQESWGVYD